MPPAGGEEWSEVYVTRKEYKSVPCSADLEEPLGTVGAASDACRCVHCGKKGMSAQPQRIRAHIAGVAGNNTTVCPGPGAKRTSETPEEYNARCARFAAAKKRMQALIDKAAKEKAESEARLELDRRASGVGAAAQQPLFRPRHASAAQQEADEKLSLAFVVAGWAPNAVESPARSWWRRSQRCAGASCAALHVQRPAAPPARPSRIRPVRCAAA